MLLWERMMLQWYVKYVNLLTFKCYFNSKDNFNYKDDRLFAFKNERESVLDK